MGKFVDFGNMYNDKPMMFMLIGIPGSGKSTVAKEMAEEYHAQIFSSDAKRAELYGDESIQGDPTEVFINLHKDILQALKEGKSVIYDATNLRAKNRRAFINFLNCSHVHCYKIAYVIPKEVEECYKADNERERKVGKEVINRMVSSFEFPQYFEGWNEILILGAENTLPPSDEAPDMFIRGEMYSFDQKNPHHFETVGEHSSRVCRIACDLYKKTKNFINKFNLDTLMLAAEYHDVGKLFTQEFNEQGIAHYYNHANWSAYYLLNNLGLLSGYGWNSIEDIYFILFLVNYHMRPFQWKLEETKNKWKNIFGTYWYDALMLLHEADNLACEEAKREAEKDD